MYVEDRRALRGGSSDIFPAVLRSGFRYRNFPDNRFSSVGFRRARDL
jgi:formylglycine-generating enzyme required for sulfatase activity